MTRHSLADRVLHRFALQSRVLRKFSFSRECERNHRRFDRQREHVFIAGLARSGSTALLNALHTSGVFAATTYELMPFVLAPSLARVSGGLSKPSASPVERRHGDSLRVGVQSAEALDGIFWNTYLPSNDNPQRPREVPRSVLQRYAMFIENTLQHYDKARYLSKMNQGIGLLPDLARWFERSLFLVPFREPLQQASSLLRQHRRFARLDGYETTYFEWLEHHEFGATHRAFSADMNALPPTNSPTRLDYWLEQWRSGYGYLAQLADSEPNILPLGYERMAESDDAWRHLSECLAVPIPGNDFKNCNTTGAEIGDADPFLLNECRNLYQRLLSLSEAKAC